MKRLILFLMLLISVTPPVVRPVVAAVALDVCSTATAVGATSLTWSHTVTGTNPLLVSGFQGQGGSGGEVTGITYNAVTMTFKSLFYGSHDPGPGIETYYKTGVATGTHNVVISNEGSVDYVGSACSFTGVDQAAPLGTAVTNEANPLDSGSVTVPSNGMAYELGLFARGTLGCVGSTATAGGQTKQYEDCANIGAGESEVGFGSTRTATGSFTYALDTNEAYYASLALPINPAASAATTTATRRRNQ